MEKRGDGVDGCLVPGTVSEVYTLCMQHEKEKVEWLLEAKSRSSFKCWVWKRGQY